jgi:hypothetical protein
MNSYTTSHRPFRRKALTGGVATVAVVAIAMLSSGWSIASSAGSTPAIVRTAHAGYPHTYVDQVVQQKWLDPGPTTLGAFVATTSNVLDLTGHQIGTEDFSCVVVGVSPPKDLMQCMAETQLPKGTLDGTFTLDRALLETVGSHYTTETSGGTGAYVGVHGQTHWTVLAPGVARADSVQLTFPS